MARPAEQDGEPVGTLWVGIAGLGATVARRLRLPGSRDQMRQMAVISSLDLLRHALLDQQSAGPQHAPY
ncbi:MAG: CinA family protein [Ilumatobacteraceae bacterium]